MMQAVQEAARDLGAATACDALGVARASFYRWRAPLHGPHRQPAHPRALAGSERTDVLAVLHEERFVDKAPVEVYATLLDEGRYLCSVSTLYRILRDNAEVRERRDQLRHPTYSAPELLAERPNQVWSWDITKLLGPGATQLVLEGGGYTRLDWCTLDLRDSTDKWHVRARSNTGPGAPAALEVRGPGVGAGARMTAAEGEPNLEVGTPSARGDVSGVARDR